MDTKTSKISFFSASLANQLLKRIFGFYLVIAVLVTAFQLYLNHQHITDDFKNELISSAQTSDGTLSSAIWDFNMGILQAKIEGMNYSERVVGVSVYNDSLESIGSVGEINLNHNKNFVKGFEERGDNLLVLVWPLIYTDQLYQERRVGTLEIYSSQKLILQRVNDDLLLIVVNALLKSLALWGIAMLVLNKMLFKPLLSITRDLDKVDNTSLKSEEIFNRVQSDSFELFELQSGFKKMLARLNETFNELSQKEQLLEKQSKHDKLTGLPNRSYFDEESKRILSSANRYKKMVGILFFDLNGFKKVNDSYGHYVGDQLLIQVSQRLKESVRENDFLARMSGDEFVIITEMMDNLEELYPVVKKVMTQFDKAFQVEGFTIISSPALGVTYTKNHELDVEYLLKQADLAMYEAKKQKEASQSVCFYTDEMAQQFSRIQLIESNIHKALSNNEFSTVFQPVYNKNNITSVSVEALIRWKSPTLGVVSTSEFIPIIEKSPIINDLSLCVLEDCLSLFEKAKSINLKINKIAFNVSASQLTNSTFTNTLISWIEEKQVDPAIFCLELTERQLIVNEKQCYEQIQKLRGKGFIVALDDFGSGYSSLTHLLNYPIDLLKLDRVLIENIDTNELNQALVAGIVEMSHRLKLQVLAEGVEYEREFNKVLSIGCDCVQGFYYSKPIQLDEIIDFYENKVKEHKNKVVSLKNKKSD